MDIVKVVIASKLKNNNKLKNENNNKLKNENNNKLKNENKKDYKKLIYFKDNLK